MIELTLDYSNWRCGGYPFEDTEEFPNMLGKGSTLLLNKEGYMCCLGQFACQLGVPKDNLLKLSEPDELPLDDTIPFLTYISDEGRIRNSDFSKKAIDINDNKRTTPLTKIDQLKALCKANDIMLTVINLPIK